MQQTPVVRHSSRVLVIDRRDRVLLFAARASDEIPVLWLPPGGGLEPDETHEQAAVRELWEEVGLREPRLSACVWQRRVVVRWGDRLIDSRERFFVCRVLELDIERHVNLDVLERDSVLGHRWWTREEIEAAADHVFVPRSLGRLLAPLLRGELPCPPLVLED